MQTSTLVQSEEQPISFPAAYFLPPSSRRPIIIGDPMQADCAIVWAFGRREIDDKVLNAMIHKFRTSSAGLTGDQYGNTLQVFQSIKAEKDLTFSAGRSNKKLARAMISAYQQVPGIVFAAQWEVAYALWEYYPSFWEEIQVNNSRIYILWPEPHYDSYRAYHVAKDGAAMLQQCNRNRPMAIALRPMRERAIGMSWKVGLDVIVPPDSFFGAEYMGMDDFDKFSIQLYTRDQKAWNEREPLVRVHHFVFGHVRLIPPHIFSTRR